MAEGVAESDVTITDSLTSSGSFLAGTIAWMLGTGHVFLIPARSGLVALLVVAGGRAMIRSPR